MRRRDFETLVARMAAELPAEYREGIEAITVTRKTVPHPVRRDVYTLGECIPHEFGAPDEEGPRIRSSVELHYGSFAALARVDPDFDWRREAWETLTHEVRHHLEWRARVPELEALDEAVEANYARRDGEDFPPLFHLAGERLAPGVTKIEDDVFLDHAIEFRAWKAAHARPCQFEWHGRTWQVSLPPELPDVLMASVQGVTPRPPGELVLVVRRKPGARDILRRATVGSVSLRARPSEARR
jgi:hypothetical protein